MESGWLSGFDRRLSSSNPEFDSRPAQLALCWTLLHCVCKQFLVRLEYQVTGQITQWVELLSLVHKTGVQSQVWTTNVFPISWFILWISGRTTEGWAVRWVAQEVTPPTLMQREQGSNPSSRHRANCASHLSWCRCHTTQLIYTLLELEQLKGLLSHQFSFS